jgi:hypothetical protein
VWVVHKLPASSSVSPDPSVSDGVRLSATFTSADCWIVSAALRSRRTRSLPVRQHDPTGAVGPALVGDQRGTVAEQSLNLGVTG